MLQGVHLADQCSCTDFPRCDFNALAASTRAQGGIRTRSYMALPVRASWAGGCYSTAGSSSDTPFSFRSRRAKRMARVSGPSDHHSSNAKTARTFTVAGKWTCLAKSGLIRRSAISFICCRRVMPSPFAGRLCRRVLLGLWLRDNPNGCKHVHKASVHRSRHKLNGSGSLTTSSASGRCGTRLFRTLFARACVTYRIRRMSLSDSPVSSPHCSRGANSCPERL